MDEFVLKESVCNYQPISIRKKFSSLSPLSLVVLANPKAPVTGDCFCPIFSIEIPQNNYHRGLSFAWPNLTVDSIDLSFHSHFVLLVYSHV